MPERFGIMIGNTSLKSILKRYPAALKHFRFLASARGALSNRSLKKREIREFAHFLAHSFEAYDGKEDAEIFLETLLDRRFKKDPPRDALLHLCADAIVCALILFLDFCKSKNERPDRWQRACLLFEGYLKIDQMALYKKYSTVNRILEQRNFLSYAQSDKETRRAICRKVYDYARIHGIKEQDAAAMIDRHFLEDREREKKRIFNVLLVVVPLLLSLLALFLASPTTPILYGLQTRRGSQVHGWKRILPIT